MKGGSEADLTSRGAAAAVGSHELATDGRVQTTPYHMPVEDFIGHELVAELEEEGLPVFKSYLTSSVKMKESHRAHRPLIDLAPSHKLTGQFLDLHAELEQAAARVSAA